MGANRPVSFQLFLTKIRWDGGHKWLAPLVLLQSGLSLGQTQWWGMENPVSHCVSLLLSVTERTLRSLAELQEAVLQCPVSDPTALPASHFPSVPSFWQAIRLSSLLCSAAGQRSEQLLQHRACGEL